MKQDSCFAVKMVIAVNVQHFLYIRNIKVEKLFLRIIIGFFQYSFKV